MSWLYLPGFVSPAEHFSYDTPRQQRLAVQCRSDLALMQGADEG
jgi:hypothetical protein